MCANQKTPPNRQSAYARLSKLCVRREICAFDAKRRLILWGLERDDQDAVIADLIMDKFIDDQRYAIAFARDKSRFDRWGSEKIKQALCQRRISGAAIKLALDEVSSDTENLNLQHLLERKLQTLKPELALLEKRNKLIRFGLGRGYSPDQIFACLKGILSKQSI